jgi:prevent-host-death family protein
MEVNRMITTFSSREFNQDTSRAKKAAQHGPVFITARGSPAHVLLSIDEYRRITSQQQNIVALLAMPAASDIAFEPPRLGGKLYQPAELL